ncbi:MAG: Phosphopantetheine attachment site [Smithella sp. PtaU1.Bin162]|jgi:acyl carrier protein|nr:MAG: Phosphopantetheine attachment site [Smithella sp. PtaU1.Bin162]
MSKTLEKLKSGILETFPEIGDVPISPEMQLGEIPEWDSIAAVNLQTYLRENFGIDVQLDFLNNETTLADIAEFIEKSAALKQRLS